MQYWCCLLSSQAETLFVILFGFIILLAVIWGVWWRRAYDRRVLKITAFVTSCKYGGADEDGHPYYMLKLRFFNKTTGEETNTQAASVTTRNVGSEVPILFDPKNPKGDHISTENRHEWQPRWPLPFSARWTFQACYNPSSWTGRGQIPFHPLIRSYESCHRPRHAKHRHRPSMSPHRRKRGPSQTIHPEPTWAKQTHFRNIFRTFPSKHLTVTRMLLFLLGKRERSSSYYRFLIMVLNL